MVLDCEHEWREGHSGDDICRKCNIEAYAAYDELKKYTMSLESEIEYRRTHPNDPLMQCYVQVGWRKDGKVHTIYDTVRELRDEIESLESDLREER